MSVPVSGGRVNALCGFQGVLASKDAGERVDYSGRMKIAIVTGAAQGIGRRTAEVLAGAGYGLMLMDMQPCTATAAAVRKAGVEVAEVLGDISDEAVVGQAVKVVRELWGRVDVLVNNAGISVVKPLHEHSAEEWDAVMNSNVKAIYWAARSVIPVMIRQKAGVILNTGSISGETGIATQGAYGPSKGAVHQMTRQMAVEYARFGIRVNAIACGTVDTPIVHKSAEASGDAEKYWAMLRENHPIGRIATADEVACFFTYMASDLASFFTGAVLMMDGGYTAR